MAGSSPIFTVEVNEVVVCRIESNLDNKEMVETLRKEFGHLIDELLTFRIYKTIHSDGVDREMKIINT